ncbi:glycosyltransferase [Cohnella sp. 56]|uniref:glycosyltransferase n=1 Tax=Cohnella sp. 56 TaxID=3113722 RepID=UPI0030E8DCD9
MNIVFASHTYMGGPFVVGSHHLAREMKRLGHRVLHMSTPLSPMHLLKYKDRDIRERIRIYRGEREAGPEQAVNSVPMSLLPWELAGPIYARTGKNWTLPRMKRLLRSQQMERVDLLLIDQPRFAGLDKVVKPAVTVYRPTDLYAQMTGDSSIAAAEAAIMASAHGLVSTSEPVLGALQPYNPALPSLLLENGVEFAHFAAGGEEPEDMRAIPGPRAVYVGALDERLDLDALRRLADAWPELGLVIIGPPSEAAAAALGGRPNVHLLGPKPYKDVPRYLHHADVALLPLSDHAANRGRSPMKLYEYAAAGLPVVVTETPELLRREEPFLYFYRQAGEFPAQVRAAIAARHGRERIRAMAERHAWDAKAAALLEFAAGLRRAVLTEGRK